MINLNQARGVTLLELLITLAIATALMTAVVPGFSNVIANTQVETATDKLIRAAFLARTESIKRGQRVITCLSNTDTACDSSSPAKLLIFADPDRSGAPTSPADIIRTLELKEPAITITYNRPFLAYLPTGHAAGTNGTFTVCHTSGIGNMIIISTLGRPRKAIDYDGDGIVEKTPGKPLNC
ncbi:GspH/FimT family pseudopilin [Marinobacter sp. TBZ242]|uniref:Type II secretion system protein H n=1 Tax=Marinobacter azerbaijanicus TaxID=3050455 RepID=A0ABT7IGX8_9GAMM|nr:GspH/FimT family pseudopilin [Marinobacter sp. TBZ242]MDL0433419.1 GspH/FimT family pseudopilin [Marinobacter sp. TBZ242]